MKLDLAELDKGISVELEKSAWAIPAAAKAVGGRLLKALPGIGNVISGGAALHSASQGDWAGAGLNAIGAIPGIGNVAQLGAMGADMLMPDSWRQNFNSAVTAPYKMYQAAKAVPGQVANFAKSVAPAAGAMLMSGLNKSPVQPTATQSNNVALTHNTSGVNSLGAPKMAMFGLRDKLAGGVMEALTDAAKRRVANSVLNEFTTTNPLGMDLPAQAQKQQEAKKLELVSAHPEIAQMIENPQTKAYLERLLQTSA